MAFNNGTLKMLESFRDSMFPVMRKGEVEALDHIIEDVKAVLVLSAPSVPVPDKAGVEVAIRLWCTYSNGPDWGKVDFLHWLRQQRNSAPAHTVQRYAFDTVILGRPVPTAIGEWVRYEDVYGKKEV